MANIHELISDLWNAEKVYINGTSATETDLCRLSEDLSGNHRRFKSVTYGINGKTIYITTMG